MKWFGFNFQLKHECNGCETVVRCEMNKNIVESIANVFPCAWFWFSLYFVLTVEHVRVSEWDGGIHSGKWTCTKRIEEPTEPFSLSMWFTLNQPWTHCIHIVFTELFTLLPFSDVRECGMGTQAASTLPCKDVRVVAFKNWQQRMLSSLLFTIYYVLKSRHTGCSRKKNRGYLHFMIWRSFFADALTYFTSCCDICWNRIHSFHCCLHQHFVLLPQHTYSLVGKKKMCSVVYAHVCATRNITKKIQGIKRNRKASRFIEQKSTLKLWSVLKIRLSKRWRLQCRNFNKLHANLQEPSYALPMFGLHNSNQNDKMWFAFVYLSVWHSNDLCHYYLFISFLFANNGFGANTHCVFVGMFP